MKTYLDTSALVKLYVPEADSESLSQWLRKYNQPIPYTSLHELELKNALSLKRFWREITSAQVSQVERAINADLTNGILQRSLFNWPEVFSQAISLAATYTPKVGCRSLDILHVSSAMALACRHLITFDDKQKKLAKKAGLSPQNPHWRTNSRLTKHS